MLNITAQQAFESYEDALHNGWLRQATWNSEDDGRRVACALGVLDPSVSSASDCPASVMPKWLARMVTWLFDGQSKDDAFAWGEKFYAQLARLNGDVPFEVVYDWHANYSWQMGIEVAEKMGRDTAPAKAVQELHRRALAGDRANCETWYKALRNADAYAYANANAYAYAYGYADAYADAYANADAYADAYANAYARKKAINLLAMGLVECLERVRP